MGPWDKHGIVLSLMRMMIYGIYRIGKYRAGKCFIYAYFNSEANKRSNYESHL